MGYKIGQYFPPVTVLSILKYNLNKLKNTDLMQISSEHESKFIYLTNEGTSKEQGLQSFQSPGFT